MSFIHFEYCSYRVQLSVQAQDNDATYRGAGVLRSWAKRYVAHLLSGELEPKGRRKVHAQLMCSRLQGSLPIHRRCAKRSLTHPGARVYTYDPTCMSRPTRSMFVPVAVGYNHNASLQFRVWHRRCSSPTKSPGIINGALGSVYYSFEPIFICRGESLCIQRWSLRSRFLLFVEYAHSSSSVSIICLAFQNLCPLW